MHPGLHWLAEYAPEAIRLWQNLPNIKHALFALPILHTVILRLAADKSTGF